MALGTRVSAGPQDVLFGIRHANIVPRLTTDNWQARATARVLGQARLYVWIAKGTCGGDEVYLVSVEGDGNRCWDLGARFPTLSQALAYANGEDGGGLAATAPANRSQFPSEQGAAMVVSGVRHVR